MIIDLLHQDGFQPRRKGSDEHSSPCPACGGADRFIIKTTNQGARYFCRQCEIKGDSIEYLRIFRGMSYQQAAEYAGKPITELTRRQGASTANHTPSSPAIDPPSEYWAAKAEELAAGASSALLEDGARLSWLLAERGLTRKTAERFQLGWIDQNIYSTRAAWGLPEKLGDDGKPKKLFIPAGLLIPGPDRVRIRRKDAGEYGKYYVIPGSGKAPMIINGDRRHDVTPAIIVESELDAILLCQELKDKLLIVATGSTANGPTEELIEDLRRRPFVLVSLDGDSAGGKAAWSKWLAVLRNACRAPIPPSLGKDHGEAYRNGLDLNVWLSACHEIVMEMCNEAPA